MVNFLQDYFASLGSEQNLGSNWGDNPKFFDYNNRVQPTEEETFKIIKDHIENEVIKEAAIYKTPIERWIPMTESVLFHAYLVYRACDKEHKELCNWWSVEKTSSSYELQRSKSLYHVVNLKRDKPRVENSVTDKPQIPKETVSEHPEIHLSDLNSLIGNVAAASLLNPEILKNLWYNYIRPRLVKKGEPQVNIRDICKTGASPFTVFKFMPEEAGYLYYENNCKRYVQKIFNEISECKKWNPVAP